MTKIVILSMLSVLLFVNIMEALPLDQEQQTPLVAERRLKQLEKQPAMPSSLRVRRKIILPRCPTGQVDAGHLGCMACEEYEKLYDEECPKN